MAEHQRAPLRKGQLTEGWRWVLTIGWALMAPALAAIGDASHSFGKPTWWLDEDGRATVVSILPFIPMMAAAFVAAVNWRHWPYVAFGAVASLAITAWVDAGNTSPGVAAAEAMLALAGLATSTAALAGRVTSDVDPAPQTSAVPTALISQELIGQLASDPTEHRGIDTCEPSSTHSAGPSTT
jgi:hypothetical protein